MTKILSDEEVMGFLYKYADRINECSTTIDLHITNLTSEIKLSIKSKPEIELMFKKLLKLMKKINQEISHFYEWKKMIDFIGEISPETIYQPEYTYFEGMPETINSWLIYTEYKINQISYEIDCYAERL